jgi:hypothetical protein
MLAGGPLMANKLLHVIAFEEFRKATPNPLEAMIAFGLFMDSEDKWAKLKQQWPSDETYCGYHEIYLTPHEIQGYIDNAKSVLQQFGGNLVEIERPKFLSQALVEYERAASIGHRRFRFRGVLEAVAGAFLWTVILISFAIILARGGIDVVEYYRRAVGNP